MMSLDDLKDLARRHAGTGPDCAVPGLRVHSRTAPSEPVCGIEEPAFAVILQGRKRTTVAGRTFEYGPGDCLIVSLSMPSVGQVIGASEDEPYLGIGLTLRPADIAGLLLEADSEACLQADAGPSAVHAASPQLLDALGRLVTLLDRPEDVRILRPLLEREILWRLLNGPHGPMLREVGSVDSRASRIGRAIRWLQQHYAETVSTQQLETVSGMSASTLFRHFKEFTSMSPLQYQKQIRLHEARARLAASSRDVAAVAYQVGYESPSQFTREYTRMFGRPPRDDLKRMREQVA
ncbi:AraC family transcriptional regulator [uncultured Massilia sp.]|uniref:AraC family transcriptional regulator n=1 Tax=uncultured Massilia sp. TaxID=169973 RepID=UPI0025E8CF29|nr:AraC family transcriptional regulator [uncultured Massilia sp.]